MKIKCKANDLSRAFDLAQSVAPPRSSLSVLGCALIEARATTLVSGTDMEKYVTSFVSCEDILEPGGICLPIKHTGDLLANLGDADITLEVADKKATIKSAHGKYTISGISADEFPVIPEVKGAVTVTMSARGLRGMLKQTLFACSEEESKGVMQGVLFEVKHGNVNSHLRLIATDSSRLSATTTVVECNGTDEVAVIIDAKALAPLSKALDTTGTVTIVFSERSVSFEVGSTLFQLPVYGGTFPNCKSILAQPDDAATIRIDRKALFDSLKRASVILGDDAVQRVRFDVCVPDEGWPQLLISTAEATKGSEGFEGIDCHFSDGGHDVIRFALKCNFLLEYLNVIGSDEVMIYTGGEMAKLLLREIKANDNGDDVEDTNYTHVIGPIAY